MIKNMSDLKERNCKNILYKLYLILRCFYIKYILLYDMIIFDYMITTIYIYIYIYIYKSVSS